MLHSLWILAATFFTVLTYVFVKWVPPQKGQVKPWGISSSAGSSNQALEPRVRNTWETVSMVSGVQTGLPQSSQ